MFKTFYNSRPQKMFLSKKYPKKEINFSIRFSTGQSFNVSGYPSETIQSILDKTIKQNNLDNFRSKIDIVIFESSKIELNKTLSENKIK